MSNTTALTETQQNKQHGEFMPCAGYVAAAADSMAAQLPKVRSKALVSE
jgi:hypothetical protein